MELKAEIEKIAEELEGTLGVSVKNLETGEEAVVNGEMRFPMASVFKIPVITTLYRKVDAGEIDLDDEIELTGYAKVPGSGVLKELTLGLKLKIRDYRTLMMTISDNTATDTIVDLVGKGDVNKAMSELGLKKTTITKCRDILFKIAGLGDIDPKDRTMEIFIEKMKGRKIERVSKELKRGWENVTTPRDMMVLLEKIYRGEAASRGSCNKIIELMKKCQTGENRIWKYLPRDRVEVAHKTGTVDSVVNDVSLVFPKGKTPYILCAFTKDVEAEGGSREIVAIGEEAIAKVSKIAYEYFTA